MATRLFDAATNWTRARIGATTVVAYTNVSAANASALDSGLYRISCTTDAYIYQGGAAVVATTSSYPLYIGQEAFAEVTPSAVSPDVGASNAYVAAIRQTANGNMSLSCISFTVG